jgi:hypothetical protein
MGKFRKRPVVIDAVHFSQSVARDGWPDETLTRTPWLAEAVRAGKVYICRERREGHPVAPPFLIIQTLEGPLTGLPGDWIIRGVAGEVYACKPDIFAATYERAEGAAVEGPPSERLFPDGPPGAEEADEQQAQLFGFPRAS